MIYDDIDWEQMWLETFKGNSLEKEAASRKGQWVKKWDDIAEKFDELNKPVGSHENDCYIRNMISRIEFNEDSTVLDIGSGPGTLSISLAKKVKHVTAIDMSKNMIKLVEKNMKKEDITNITTLNKSWEDIKLGKDIEKHDIVIASRSLGGLNLKNDLLKIMDATREKAYISSLAKDNNFDRTVYEAVGKTYEFTPHYIYVYNLLYQLGNNAEIDIFTCKGGTIHKDFNEAYSYFKWHMQNLIIKEEEMLRKVLADLFENKKSKCDMPESKWDWALISWSKDD
jgi:predicted TPR repeat methyltransferase